MPPAAATQGPGADPARRERMWRGQALSLLLHGLLLLALLWAVLPPPDDAELAGTGWADEIAITASDRSSSGFAGTAEENRRASAPERGPSERDVMLVEIVSPSQLVPAAPAPPETAPEAPEPRTQKRIELALPATPPLPAPSADETARAPEDLGALARGGQGLQDAPLGSRAGTDTAGAGQGDSDRRGRGRMLRGDELAAALQGFTIVGREGFWDGSTTSNGETRTAYPWAVYYAAGGAAEARFQRPAAAVPHGPIRVREFSEDGEWRIEGDLLCQRIDRIGSGAPVCFEVHRDGEAVAMYYARCGALTRCRVGRLGPEGVLVPGRAL